MRTDPIYVDPEAFCWLQREADLLNHRFAPYEAAMDRYHLPKAVCQRLIRIDSNLLHVNAGLISREVPPRKIQRQIHWIQRDLAWMEARIGVIPPMERCCKSPEAMAASLDRWIEWEAGRPKPPRIPPPSGSSERLKGASATPSTHQKAGQKQPGTSSMGAE